MMIILNSSKNIRKRKKKLLEYIKFLGEKFSPNVDMGDIIYSYRGKGKEKSSVFIIEFNPSYKGNEKRYKLAAVDVE